MKLKELIPINENAGCGCGCGCGGEKGKVNEAIDMDLSFNSDDDRKYFKNFFESNVKSPIWEATNKLKAANEAFDKISKRGFSGDIDKKNKTYVKSIVKTLAKELQQLESKLR